MTLTIVELYMRPSPARILEQRNAISTATVTGL
jgi:hypothetical protein